MQVPNEPLTEDGFYNSPSRQEMDEAFAAVNDPRMPKRKRNLRFPRRGSHYAMNGVLVGRPEDDGDYVTVLLKVTNHMTSSPGIWRITINRKTGEGRGQLTDALPALGSPRHWLVPARVSF